MAKVENSPQRRIFMRAPQRLTCELRVDGKWQPGIVLDVSARGLFVQTSLTAPVGTQILVRLRASGQTPIEIAATVARSRRPHRDVASIAKPGLGLEIGSAEEAYFQLLLGLDASE